MGFSLISTTPKTVEKYAQGFVVLAFFLCAILAVFGGNGLVPILVAASLPCLFYCVSNKGHLQLNKPFKLLLLIVGGWLTYGLVNVSWAIEASEGLNLWFRLLALTLTGFGVVIALGHSAFKPKTDKIILATFVGAIVALTITWVEITTNGAIHQVIKGSNPTFKFDLARLNRASAIFMLLLFPLGYYLYRTKGIKAALVLVAIMIATIFSLNSQSAMLSVLVAGAVFGASLWLKHYIFTIAKIVFLAVLVLWPVVTSQFDFANIVHLDKQYNVASVGYRMHIWDFTAKKATEHALGGWGLHASRYVPFDDNDLFEGHRTPMPLHPHNHILQIFIELGGIGLLFFGATIIGLIRTIELTNASVHWKASALALLTGYLTAGMAGFGVWQNWWLAAAFLASALMAHMAREN